MRLNHDLGLTIILAEQRLERVLPFVDSVIYLPAAADDGTVLYADTLTAMQAVKLVPPLVAVGKALGWQPLPLTVKEGLRFSRPWLAAQRQAGAALPLPSVQRQPRGEPTLQARGLRVRYRRQEILRGVDLSLWPGEIVVLMGRNGAGKTTLLRTLVGLLRPYAGDVSIGGHPNTGRTVAEICRQVGYLPQDPNTLLFAESVQDELLVTLHNHQGSEDLQQENFPSQLLARLGLADKTAAYPRDLSVGERQRVALAAVTVTQPATLLLDEPTRGLDYQAKMALEQLLRGWRDDGTAILVVTHDVELAAVIADRVILMSQGEIIAEGPPTEVLATSPLFAPQIARLFPETGWLTAKDVTGALQCQD